jgi:hypothetical protein
MMVFKVKPIYGGYPPAASVFFHVLAAVSVVRADTTLFWQPLTRISGILRCFIHTRKSNSIHAQAVPSSGSMDSKGLVVERVSPHF